MSDNRVEKIVQCSTCKRHEIIDWYEGDNKPVNPNRECRNCGHYVARVDQEDTRDLPEPTEPSKLLRTIHRSLDHNSGYYELSIGWRDESIQLDMTRYPEEEGHRILGQSRYITNREFASIVNPDSIVAHEIDLIGEQVRLMARDNEHIPSEESDE
jgi:Zn ribbon nucleic-acid-binding protein